MDNYKLPKINEINVSKQAFGSTMAVSRRMMDDLAGMHADHTALQADIEEIQDNIMGHLLYTLRTYLLKSVHAEKQTFSIEVPATWWDHLKQDLCDSHRLWVQRIGFMFAPPKYRTESKEFEVSVRLCPHNDSYLSKDSAHHFSFLEWKE